MLKLLIKKWFIKKLLFTQKLHKIMENKKLIILGVFYLAVLYQKDSNIIVSAVVINQILTFQDRH